MIRRPPRSTRIATLFPYTTLLRSGLIDAVAEIAADVGSDHFAEIVAPVEHGEHHALKRPVLVQAAAHPVDGAHEMAETLTGIELRLQRPQHRVGPDTGAQGQQPEGRRAIDDDEVISAAGALDRLTEPILRARPLKHPPNGHATLR